MNRILPTFNYAIAALVCISNVFKTWDYLHSGNDTHYIPTAFIIGFIVCATLAVEAAIKRD